jgi:hypothetical protein
MESKGPQRKSPSDLTPRGRMVWRKYTDEYKTDDPGDDELLRLLCCLVDQSVWMSQRLKADGVVTRGSMDQKVAHPLLSDFRFHAALIAKIVKQLHPSVAGGSKPRVKKSGARVVNLVGAKGVGA